MVDCGFKWFKCWLFYSCVYDVGLGFIIKYFGLILEVFGDNLKVGYKVNIDVLFLVL